MDYGNIIRSSIREKTFLLILFFFGNFFLGCAKDSTNDIAKKLQSQENAISALVNLGAKMDKVDLGDARRKGMAVDLSQVRFDSEIADHLKLLEFSVHVLNLSKTSIDDNQLGDLIDHKVLVAVVELDLSHNPAITDQALEKLEPLPFLRDLNLTGTHVTEAAITRLQQKRKMFDLKTKENDNESGSNKMALPEYLKREFKVRH